MEDFSRLDQEQQEAALEYLHYLKVLKHFQNYKSHCDTRILAKYQRDFQALSEEDKAIIPWYPGKLDQIKELVGRNQEVLFQMIQSHVDDIEEDEQEVDVPQNRMKEFVSAEQAQENIRSLLRQLVRDWSEEGVKERIMSYGPIVNALEDYFPGTEERNKAKVLVPGAGLGRLVHDLSNLGFDCQGNEFSLFMLLPSEWILNSGPKPGEKTIYPWILPFSNHLSVEDQTRPVLIPDITPTAPTTGGSMSMTAGDFLSVYTEPESWNVIVTCFFLDTAKNVVEYIRRINQLLVPGGTWINHGPLLYHFEGSAEQSIELSMEEICRVIQGFGLEIMQEARYDCPYTQDSLSMHQTVYQTHFMVIHKKGFCVAKSKMVYETRAGVMSSASKVETLFDKCSEMIYKARCLKTTNEPIIQPFLEYFAKEGVTPRKDPVTVAWAILRQGGLLCTLLNEYRGNTIESKSISMPPVDGSLSEDNFKNNKAVNNVRMFVTACREELFLKTDELFDPPDLYSDNMNSLNKALAITEMFFQKLKRVKGIRFEKMIAAMKEEEAAANQAEEGAEEGSAHEEGAEAKPTEKRLIAIKEILTSEQSYISDLDYLFKYYEELKVDKVIPADVIAQIFANFEELTNFQQRYAYLVESTLSKDVLKSVEASYGVHAFKKLFIDQENEFDVYMKYVANLPTARALVKEHMDALMQKQHQMDPQGQLDSFLIKPTQRLCKYPLLIREVIRNSAQDAPDMDELKEAYAATDRNAARVNELLAQGENDVEAERMKELVTDWTIGKTRIDKDGLGHLIRYQKVQYMKDSGSGTEASLYLFERRLIMCRPGKTMLRNTPTLNLKWSVLPDNIHSYEDATKPMELYYGFRIYFYSGEEINIISFSTRNAESVKLWMKAFRKLEIPSHDEAPQEESSGGEPAIGRRASLLARRRSSIPVGAAAAGAAGAAAMAAMAKGRHGEKEEEAAPAAQPNERAAAASTSSASSQYTQVKIVYGEDAYILLLPHVPSVEQFRRLAVKTIRADYEARGKAFNLDKETMRLKYRDDVGDLINVIDDSSLTMAYRYITPTRLTLHIL